MKSIAREWWARKMRDNVRAVMMHCKKCIMCTGLVSMAVDVGRFMRKYSIQWAKIHFSHCTHVKYVTVYSPYFLFPFSLWKILILAKLLSENNWSLVLASFLPEILKKISDDRKASSIWRVFADWLNLQRCFLSEIPVVLPYSHHF